MPKQRLGYKYSGFTLIELLIVIVIIAALAIAVFISFNPVKRLQDARNARRIANVDSIRTAIQSYLVDKSSLPPGLSSGMPETQIGTSNGSGVGGNNPSCINTSGSCNATSQSCVDLSGPLATYLKTIPQDPQIGSAAATGYSVSVDSHNIVTVNSCGTEGHTFVYVIRSGSMLTYNGMPFRFSGTNIYWLGLDENNGGSASGVHYPTKYAVDDALNTAKEMGVTVVRSHSLGVSTGCATYSTPNTLCIEPSLNTFNDQAFNTIDYAIYAAGQRGIKLIIPLTDGNGPPCFFHGCYDTFDTWAGVSNGTLTPFLTNPTVIGYFEAYINHLLNHVNAYNGIALKNDPTIMAWETGNELDDNTSNTTNWEATISQYIKSIDSNHLVMDGSWTMDSGHLSIPTVDLYTRHHYASGGYYPSGTGTAITDDDHYGCAAVAAGKVYVVGEYDWTQQKTTPLQLNTYLPNVETYTCPSTTSYAVTGDLFWSLFPHRDTHGFETHGDGYTLNYAGNAAWMRTQAQALRNHAYTISGISIPSAATITAAPLLRTPVVSGGVQLTWQGVATAAYYQIERSNDGGVTWTVISPVTSPADGTSGGVTDNDDQSSPWVDTTGTGSSLYRIRAFNLTNNAGPYSSGYNNSTSVPPTH